MGNERFAAITREAVGEDSLRKVSLRCGVSHTCINDMLSGRVPLRPTLLRFADGLGLSGELRARLFQSAGYLDNAPDLVGAV